MNTDFENIEIQSLESEFHAFVVQIFSLLSTVITVDNEEFLDRFDKFI